MRACAVVPRGERSTLCRGCGPGRLLLPLSLWGGRVINMRKNAEERSVAISPTLSSFGFRGFYVSRECSPSTFHTFLIPLILLNRPPRFSHVSSVLGARNPVSTCKKKGGQKFPHPARLFLAHLEKPRPRAIVAGTVPGTWELKASAPQRGGLGPRLRVSPGLAILT